MHEALIYAMTNALDSVSYGGIWSATKYRYTCKDHRKPVYYLAFFDTWWKSALFVSDFFQQQFVLNAIRSRFAGGEKSAQLVSNSG